MKLNKAKHRISGKAVVSLLYYTMVTEGGKNMEWVKGLQKAIDYIEDHITEDIDYAEIAKQAYSSSFHFQRVFHIICGYSIGEYIRNRRLSLAGTDLSSGNEKVIDIALKYGYNSPESFSRAFTKFHGITPVQAKNEGGTTMDYRIEKREEFEVIAKRARYGGGQEISQKNIHATWAACGTDGTIDTLCRYVNPENIFGGAIVGICFDNPTEGDFDYAIGAAYSGGDVATGLTIEKVPANTWAVFPCTGKMPEAFQDLYRKIYTEFFPTSKYQPAGGMCIEVYPSDEIHDDNFHFEIWLSVEEK